MWFENQFPYFCQMLLCGAAAMLLYDFLRVRRRLYSVGDFWVNIEDFVFAAAVAIGVFYITYLKNNGSFRWQTAIGFAVGAGFYRAVFRDRLVALLCKVLMVAARIFKKVLKIVFLPLVFVLKILQKPARVVFWYSGRGLNRFRRAAKIKKTRARIRLLRLKHIMRKK